LSTIPTSLISEACSCEITTPTTSFAFHTTIPRTTTATTVSQTTTSTSTIVTKTASTIISGIETFAPLATTVCQEFVWEGGFVGGSPNDNYVHGGTLDAAIEECLLDCASNIPLFEKDY